MSPPKGQKNGGNTKIGGIAPSNLEIALLKQYPFDSAVQRMTVVAKKKGAQYYTVFVKGAPEKVASFCRSETSKFSIVFNLVFVLILFIFNSPSRIFQSLTVLHKTRIQGHRGVS